MALNKFLFRMCLAAMLIGDAANASAEFITLNNLGKKVDGIAHYKSSHEFSYTFGALKYLNGAFQYQYEIKPVKSFSINAGLSYSFLSYRFFSASDEHLINARWVPVHMGARLHLKTENNSVVFTFLVTMAMHLVWRLKRTT